MRVDDGNRLSAYDRATLQSNLQGSKPKGKISSSSSGATTGAAQSETSSQASSTQSSSDARQTRLDQLKLQMSQGKPIDAAKLADSMIQSGVFVDEQA